MMTTITLRPYTAELAEEWNNLVSTSRNATFLFLRNFMDYHAHRFVEVSLMFYDRKGRLIALFPASYDEAEGVVCSHAGLTYGGLLLPPSTKSEEVFACYEALVAYYRALGAMSLRIKPIPNIYHRSPASEELYVLFRLGATLHARALSSTIDCTAPLPFSTLRQRLCKKARAAGIICKPSTEFAPFWEILTTNLRAKYDVAPVHALSEIQLLHHRFPEQIQLFIATNADEECLAGLVSFRTATTLHFQYLASSPKGRELGALDAVVTYVIDLHSTTKASELRYIDFGISTERGGQCLNTGLIAQKEGFGARGTIYDEYELKL